MTATKQRPGKILVTGGTGFVGRAVVSRLIAEGCAVRVLVRDPARVSADPLFRGVEVVGADAGDDPPPECFVGLSAIVHLVGIIVERGGNTFDHAHVSATVRMVEGARHAGVRRFIHMTALGTRPHAVSRYHRTKWLAEEAVRASGLDWTILRPSLLIGPGSGFVAQFAGMMRPPHSWLQLGIVPCFGDGGTLFQPIDVGDVAHCVARAALDHAGAGLTLSLCGSERVPLRELLLAVAEGLGRRPSWIRASPEFYPLLIPWAWMTRSKPLVVAVPFAFARAIGWALGRLPGKLFTLDQALMLEEDNIGDPRPAAQVFGFQPRPFRESLAAALAGRASQTPGGC